MSETALRSEDEIPVKITKEIEDARAALDKKISELSKKTEESIVQSCVDICQVKNDEPQGLSDGFFELSAVARAPEKNLRMLIYELCQERPFVYGRDFKIQYLDTGELLVSLEFNFGGGRKVGGLSFIVDTKKVTPLSPGKTRDESEDI